MAPNIVRMSAPTVSVVIPTYNRLALVVEAVESVLAQSHEGLELIVVDDGSTDGTMEALERRFAGDDRVRLLRQPNGGTASARNRGVAEARAPWTAFLDSDDLWDPGYLASQLALLAASPEVDTVLSDVRYQNQRRAAATLFEDPDFLAPTSLSAMCRGAWGLPSAMVVRTDIVRELGFSARYRIIEDTEFLMRFHVRGHVCRLNPDRLVVWRRPEGEGADSKTEDRCEMLAEMLSLVDGERGSAEDRHAVDEYLYECHRTLARELVDSGQLRRARPHLLAWWRARPGRVRPLILYLRSLVAAGPSGPMS